MPQTPSASGAAADQVPAETRLAPGSPPGWGYPVHVGSEKSKRANMSFCFEGALGRLVQNKIGPTNLSEPVDTGTEKTGPRVLGPTNLSEPVDTNKRTTPFV